MADADLLRKLGVKPATGVNLLRVPANLCEKLTVDEQVHSATILFVYSVGDLERELPSVVQGLPDGHLLWIAFPKKTSSIKTDISRDNGWDTVTDLRYRTVNLIAIDDDWSAFRIQPIGNYIPSERRPSGEPRPELVVPRVLADRLATSPEASEKFEKLSYSCRKEYIAWVEQAKRPETQQRRLDATIERLIAGYKTP